jgi:hypothetical protein
MRNTSLFRSVGLFSLVATLAMLGCQPVDDGAATRAKGWDGELTNNVLPKDRQVYLTIEESGDATAADGCGKTEIDAHAILKNKCAACHSTDNTAQGLPAWNFILDDEKMKTETFSREGITLHYLVAGDPDNSQVYVRSVIARNMPPMGTDVSQTTYDRVTYSEGSVLREWIGTCMGGGPAPPSGTAGASGGSGTGGATGTTGTGGATGTTGTGGATGGVTDAGTTNNPDTGATTNPSCANGVANGGFCNAQAVSPCSLPATTCTCMAGGGGQRRWMCN